MTYRKTWLSYVIWFLYASLCVMLLAFAGYSVYSVYVKAAPAKLGALLIFPLLVCVYLALRQSALAVRRKWTLTQHSKLMLEALCVSVSFVFGFLVRLRMFRYTADILSPTLGGFVDKAFVRAGESVEPIAHGISYLYVLLLSAIFSFLGNSVSAAVFLQIVLQLLVMILGYCLVKAAAGRFTACLSLLLLAFSPVFVEKTIVIDSECLFLLMYLLGMFSVVSYEKAVLSDKPGWRHVFAAAFPGVLIGIFTFLELSTVTILFLLPLLFAGKKTDAQAGDRKKNILRLFVAVVSCVAGFFVMIGADAVVCSVSPERSLQVWAYPYLQIGHLAISLGEMYGNVFFYTGLFLPAAFLAFEFFRSGKEQDHSPWLFFSILFTPFLFWKFWTVELSGLSFFFWSVAAALGVKNCLFGAEAEVMQAKIEEINAAVSSIPLTEGYAATAEPDKEETVQKPRFLENPLPLPKKHIKKEMDYDYPISSEMMHFELDITEEDDFDF